jgi:GxxExxY protein
MPLGSQGYAPIPEETNTVAAQVVDAAFHVHKELGPGLLADVYDVCLVHELRNRGLRVAHHVLLPVRYGDLVLDAGLQLDLLVEDRVVVEIKVVDALAPVHHAQVIAYLKLSGHRVGLLINFNSALLKDGMKRIVV